MVLNRTESLNQSSNQSSICTLNKVFELRIQIDPNPFESGPSRDIRYGVFTPGRLEIEIAFFLAISSSSPLLQPSPIPRNLLAECIISCLAESGRVKLENGDGRKKRTHMHLSSSGSEGFNVACTEILNETKGYI